MSVPPMVFCASCGKRMQSFCGGVEVTTPTEQAMCHPCATVAAAPAPFQERLLDVLERIARELRIIAGGR